MPRTRKQPATDAPVADEHDADVKQAAKAVDAKVTKQAPAAKQTRTPEATVKRAVELRNEGLGLPTIAKKLMEEGHQSASGKEIRPQTVRQWLLREFKVEGLRPAPEETRAEVQAR
ncbi:MAG TPA: recombinase family protein [Gaiellaceae bacterium]|nr:recombinase family protein [Gaiellaceae bacterium]